ncbi:DUF1904 family protein [Alkalihalophilus sp. As8PL]|uniref:DUF1904 family protein n=1 Tax=Alkalihalophilus sp. As8PL TaxID=3237103 RepID=A0AB39BUN6_9BACI
MPFLRFKGFDKSILKDASTALAEQMSIMANVSPETVKIELIQVDQITETPCSVEIFMFQRDQKTHDEIAAMINHLLKGYGYSNIHIFYIILNPELYYKEGMPLNEIPRNVQPTF